MQPSPVRIMPCLDMLEGRVVKGVHFVELRDAGDPVECAVAYAQAGADELAMLDITATVENRRTRLDTVARVAEACSLPLTVGGGIGSVPDAEAVLTAGAHRVSVASAGFRQPDLLEALVRELGAEQVVVAIDVDRNPQLPSGYEVFIDGGRTATGADALAWAKQVDAYGAATILPTSKAGDGARTGYDLPLIEALASAVSASVVASGGAGTMEHFLQAAQAGAGILLAASVFHFRQIEIPALKQFLRRNGIMVCGQSTVDA